VWKVVETRIEIEDPENPTTTEEVLLQNNNIALSAIHDAIDERTFEQIMNIEMAHEACKKLEESFEGTKAIKGAKTYILKEKFASFKMKEDASVSDMFHRMEVLVNDLKELGEDQFGHNDTKPNLRRYHDQ
jgi:pyruvate dehydrogenase complex dehydrogenase (E1) component